MPCKTLNRDVVQVSIVCGISLDIVDRVNCRVLHVLDDMVNPKLQQYLNFLYRQTRAQICNSYHII